MTMDPTARDADARASASEGRQPIIVPSPDVLAIVRHRDPPVEAPNRLVPFVTRVGGDRGEGWVLTDDVVAFGPHDVVRDFAEWRSNWERVWILDPTSNLERLRGLIAELEPDTHLELALRDLLERVRESVVTPDVQLALVEQMSRLTAMIRDRDASGFGVVDVTPGSARVGLARAWPEFGGSEVLAADEYTEIRLEPDIGLVVATGAGPDRAVVPAVDEVRLDAEGHAVTGSGRTIRIEPGRGRPLAWLVPDSLRWRVRSISEILAWANTFGRLEEALQYASELGLSVRLTQERPILPPTESATAT